MHLVASMRSTHDSNMDSSRLRTQSPSPEATVGNVRIRNNESSSEEADGRHRSDANGPTVDLISVANATQFILTVDEAQPTTHIDTIRVIFGLSTHTQKNWNPNLRTIAILHWVSGVLFLVLSFLSSNSAPMVVLVALQVLSSLPAIGTCWASISAEMAHLLMHEYEYRCLTALNVLHWASACWAFTDIRGLSCMAMALTLQLSLMGDANVQQLDDRFKSSIMLILLLVTMLGFSFADLLGQSLTHSLTVKLRHLTPHDMLLLTSPTLAIFLAKGVYLRSQARADSILRAATEGSIVVSCATYAIRLALYPVAISRKKRQSSHKHLLPQDPIKTALIRSSCRITHINATQTLTGGIPRWKPSGFVLCNMLATMAFLLLIYSTIRTQLVLDDSPDSLYGKALNGSALFGTIAFCLISSRLYQKDLFKALVTNFEVLFTSAQYVTTCVLVCDMMSWDRRSVNVLSWCIWFHWLLFLDALTPPMRKYLLFRRYAAVPIPLFTIYGYILVFMLLYWVDEPHVSERMLWHRSSTSASKNVRLLSTENLLLGRLVTLVLWTSRLLWDVGVAPEDTLMFIRDAAEYTPQSFARGIATDGHHAPARAVVPLAVYANISGPRSGNRKDIIETR